LKESERFKDQFNDLDKTITEEELLTATRKLKSKKAVYSDKIRNEMIKLSAKLT
jgi:Tfp pilus assembly protein PilO